MSTARSFVDTNVFVYAVDGSSAQRSKRDDARTLLAERADELVVSTQVLQEFYVAVTRKLRTPLPADRAAEAVRGIAALDVVSIDAALVLAAVDTSRASVLSLWDALIVEAARRAGCDELLSEDLSDGQTINGVTVRNPFVPRRS